MKLWTQHSIHHLRSGRCDCGDDVHWEAMLYEQPLWAYLRGRFTYWAWMHCPRWITNHHGERRRLNFELDWTCHIPEAHRRPVAHLRLPGKVECP